MTKMKKLAQKIYDTTPGINDRKFYSPIPSLTVCPISEYPKKQSKILAGIKHEEEVGAKRARNFMAKCD
jgi:hypothetical protein